MIPYEMDFDYNSEYMGFEINLINVYYNKDNTFFYYHIKNISVDIRSGLLQVI